MATSNPPPMDPNTDQADARQLELAREQGDSCQRAFEHMANVVAHDGGAQEAGEYHYGRNWKGPVDGDYTLKVRVEPPTFMRHDEVNGCRFKKPVETTFVGVKVQRGQD